MKETKANNKVVCAGCGCEVEKENSLRLHKYGSSDLVHVCSKCVHSGYKGFVCCNSCGGADEGCWIDSTLLQNTVHSNDEGGNKICPEIFAVFGEKLYKCSYCGRWYRKMPNHILVRLGIVTELCYECYREKFLLDLEN